MSDRRSAGSSVGECGRGRSELLGRVSPLARAFSGAVMVGFFVFSWGWVAAPPDTARDILNVTPALGLVILSAYLAFSADIRITRAGYVQVDGVVLKRSFPASQILKLSADEGLRFHLKSEKIIQSAAYPGSVAGTGARRARSAQERLARLLIVESHPNWPQGVSVRLSPRLADMAVGLGLAAVLLVTTLLINAVLTR